MRYQDEMDEATVFLWGEEGCVPTRDEVATVLRSAPLDDERVDTYTNLILETWGSYLSLYVYVLGDTLQIHRVRAQGA